jgi:RNA polymerase sigma factor (sigma-70 family)
MATTIEEPRADDHIGLVVAIAHEEASRLHGVDVSDLMGWGWLGLLRACRTFDGRGSFTGWASSLIRYGIVDGLRAFYRTRRRALPLARDAGERDLAHLRACGRELEEVDARLDAEVLLAALPARERLLLERRFFDEQLLEAVGRELGVTESRACQLERRALARLRERVR